MTDIVQRQTILTGIRSNEEPTIANYFGAMQPMVNLQREYGDKYIINMFVPDLHSFTTPIDHTTLYESTIQNIKFFVAAGLNIAQENTYVYRQSFIPAHSELTWILDCFTGMGELSRMIQFKDKSNDSKESVSVGLFNYPALMAADILLYGATYVPVGEDQFQHLELTRDVATRFNHKFGDVFTIPEPTDKQTQFLRRDSGLRIRSLTDPTKKMSKSSDDTKSKILLSDTPEAASRKIMSATTDTVGVINFDWQLQPGISSLLQIGALVAGVDQKEFNAHWVGQGGYADFKRAIAELITTFLSDFQSQVAGISDIELINTLEQNETAMNIKANQTLLRVQQAVGLRK